MKDLKEMKKEWLKNFNIFMNFMAENKNFNK